MAAHILEQKHPAPGLTEQDQLPQSERFPNRLQFPQPGLHFPELRPAVQIGIPAADLIVGDQQTIVLVRQAIQKLKVVMRGAGSPVEHQKRRRPRGERSDDTIISFVVQIFDMTVYDHEDPS